MTRAARNQESAPGYDSFLDIVANLVGILVILIMVIGVRAQDAWRASELEPAKPSDSVGLPDVATPQAQAAALEATVGRIAEESDQVRGQLARGQLHRDQLRRQVETKEQAVAGYRARLRYSQRDEDELARQHSAARLRLAGLQRQHVEQTQRASKPIVLQHYPTPLAKTVFGREEHFRLLGGRLAHVPLNQLTNQLKGEAKLKLWKLKSTRQITETIGPVEGFRLQYTLERRQYAVRTSAGMARRSVVELDQFLLVPVAEDLGQPLEAALQPGSSFLRRLQSLNPDETTITVWTYPDSFLEFQRLKQHLHQLGYLTAARPLPDGYPIGGSPNGSRSAAQ